MRKTFIEYSEAATREDAENYAFWAAVIIEVSGGWMAFESPAEAEQWETQQ